MFLKGVYKLVNEVSFRSQKKPYWECIKEANNGVFSLTDV